MQIGLGISPTIPAAAVPFTPASISGLQLWLDASDGATLFTDSSGTTPATADGDPIGRWADKSGNNKHAIESDGTKKPTLKLAQKNGRNVVQFDGVNDRMTNATGLTAGTYTGAIHCLFTGSRSSDGGTYFTERSSVTVKAFSWAKYLSDHNVQSNGWTYSNKISSSDFALYSLNGAVISHKTTSTALDILRLNSLQLSLLSGAGYSATWGDVGYIIGEREAGAVNAGFPFRWTGNFFELLVYTSDLTTEQNAAVENYLAAKWGI